ncbi:MAG: glycoside hydrolase family 127 protein [Clostridia bacterium]|nr:glycoside hydrolase family 127 protein [Clostridia bacterium]
MPVIVSDKLCALDASSVQMHGIIDDKLRLVCEQTLKKIDMHALADYFRYRTDAFATGEFWGKLMRAACMTYAYTRDEELACVIRTAVDDLLSLQDADGDISTTKKDTQPKGACGSDLWERKYALMGLLEYYRVFGDERALKACCRVVRYTNDQVGAAPKTPITETGWAFCGIESSSILDPLMQLYAICAEPAAMELAQHIVDVGCCKREHMFDAIRDGKSPWEIGNNGNPKESIAKAYEMMSCFEGLLGFYACTGNTVAFETAFTFWNKVYEQEITLLGSGGADAPRNLGPGTGEQWNLTRQNQTNPDIDLMMETCVTVYWMRLCYRLLALTGEVKYADALEVSLYNAIVGALRPDGQFFEYFPKFNGSRNPRVNFSFNIKGFDLSCCTANGPTGLAMAPYLYAMKTQSGCVLNLYENGSFCADGVTFAVQSRYPLLGSAVLTVTDAASDAPVTLGLRVPGFAQDFYAICDGKMHAGTPGTYLEIKRTWQKGDSVTVAFDIPLICHPAPKGDNRAGDDFCAFTYGAILLSRDNRYDENPLAPISSTTVTDYRVMPSDCGGYLRAEIQTEREVLTLIDYASAGNDWSEKSLFVSWIPTNQ